MDIATNHGPSEATHRATSDPVAARRAHVSQVRDRLGEHRTPPADAGRGQSCVALGDAMRLHGLLTAALADPALVRVRESGGRPGAVDADEVDITAPVGLRAYVVAAIQPRRRPR